MRTTFITGCNSGFGFHLARRLIARGELVIATDASTEGLAERLAPSAEVRERLRVYALDLRDAEAVRAVAATASAWSPVDVIVNNAGYAVFGTQEETDLEAIRDLFDVNVLGQARVTQAFLAELRSRHGTIVQISSVAGRMVFPESGFYAATKYAIEALSEALFEEACTFGVRVRVVEPGAFDTNFLATATKMSRPRSPQSPYAGLFSVWDARKLGVLEKPQDPELVVDAILGSLDDPRPFFRVPVGPDARRLMGLRDALSPDAWVTLTAERNGLPMRRHESTEVLSPEEVLAGVPREALGPTLAALRFGHLDHCFESESGRAAMEVVRELAARETTS